MISLDKLKPDNLSERVGIYTIYYKPLIAEHDLNFQSSKDIDRFMKAFNARFFNRFEKYHLHVEASLPSFEVFKGELEQIRTDITQVKFENKIQEKEFKFKDLIENQNTRLGLINAYQSLTSKVITPIYIGLAIDAKEDLIKIREDYFHAKGIKRNSSSFIPEQIGEKLTYIGKPAELLFELEYLEVEDISKSDLVNLGIVLGWVLKKQNRNLLG